MNTQLQKRNLNPAPAEQNNGAGAIQQSESNRMVAEAQSEILVAKRFPRQRQQCKNQIMQACQRHSFAEDALWTYPRGGQQISGPSIRLLELIAQEWGNIDYGWRELNRQIGNADEGVIGRSECEVYAWDKQTNTRSKKQFVVEHVRDTKYGKDILESERDVYEKVANYAVRRMRSCIKTVIPSDVVNDAIDTCERTIAKGPENRSKIEVIESMVHKFNNFGVTAQDLANYLGIDDVENAGESDIVKLKGVFNALQEEPALRNDYFSEDATDSPDAEQKSTEAEPETAIGAFNADKRGGDSDSEESDGAGPSETGDDAPDETPENGPEETSELTPPKQDATKAIFSALQRDLDCSPELSTKILDWLAYHRTKTPSWGAMAEDKKRQIADKLRESSTAQVIRRRLETVLSEFWSKALDRDDFGEESKSAANMISKARRYHDVLKDAYDGS